MKPFWTVALLLFTFASCSPPRPQLVIAPVSTVPGTTILPTDAPAPTSANMPKPASAYCEEQGNRLEIRTAADGSQTGCCILPDGSECGEWAYFRGTCGFAGFTLQPTTEVVNGWRTYKNQGPGYSFQYPADAEGIIADEPQRSLIVSGSGMGGNKKVTCPVAMLPDEDVLSSEREKTAMDGLKGLAKQAHIIEVPGWGHPYGWLLQPDPVSKAILTFVQCAITGM